jgi:hypothetical protein
MQKSILILTLSLFSEFALANVFDDVGHAFNQAANVVM